MGVKSDYSSAAWQPITMDQMQKTLITVPGEGERILMCVFIQHDYSGPDGATILAIADNMEDLHARTVQSGLMAKTWTETYYGSGIDESESFEQIMVGATDDNFIISEQNSEIVVISASPKNMPKIHLASLEEFKKVYVADYSEPAETNMPTVKI